MLCPQHNKGYALKFAVSLLSFKKKLFSILDPSSHINDVLHHKFN
jgi:hypothetical protein